MYSYVFNLSVVVLLHRVTLTCHKLRKISKRVLTQEQTSSSNRISQLEFVTYFGPRRPLALVAYADGLAHARENTSRITVHDIGFGSIDRGGTRYGPKHPSRRWPMHVLILLEWRMDKFQF